MELTLANGRLNNIATSAFVLTSLFLSPLDLAKNSQVISLRVLEIKSASYNPARIAFDELFHDTKFYDEEEVQQNLDEVKLNEVIKNHHLQRSFESAFKTTLMVPALRLDKRAVLSVLTPHSAAEVETSAQSFTETIGLSSAQANRLLAAQKKFGILSQPTQVPQIQQKPEPSVVSKNSPTQNIVAGKLRLVGAAMGPGRHIHVYRTDQGFEKEQADVNYKHASFVMNLKEISGVLRAELRDDNGSVLASGFHRLKKEDLLKPIEISMAPRDRLAVNLFAFDRNPELVQSKLKSAAFPGIKGSVFLTSTGSQEVTDELGTYELPHTTPDSWTIVSAAAPKMHPSLSIESSGIDNRLPLFSESLAKAIYQLAKDARPLSQSSDSKSIVWGQVLIDDKPALGIEVSVEGEEGLEPVYLNGWIPDHKLRLTSTNGYFVMVDLPDGFYSFVARQKGQLLGFANAQVSAGQLSPITIRGSLKTEPVEIKTYDAFNGLPLGAELKVQSLQTVVKVKGGFQAFLPSIRRFGLIELSATDPDFVAARYYYSDDSEAINIPMVRGSWLAKIQAQKRISQAPGTGTIVGFTPEREQEVFLSSLEDFDFKNIVYFDASGEISEAFTAGGGFIIYNLPPGTHTLTLLDQKTDRISSRLAVIDEASTSVLLFAP